MTKKIIREKQIKQLLQITESNKQQQSDLLYQHLFELSEWQKAKVVAVTLSGTIEVDTNPVIQKAWAMGKLVCIPRTDPSPKRSMEFIEYTKASRLEVTKFGILEPIDGLIITPNQIDLVLVPGLLFNQANGQRIGFGAGYYDRYLANYPNSTASLVLDQQLANDVNAWKLNQFDIPVKILITTAGTIYE